MDEEILCRLCSGQHYYRYESCKERCSERRIFESEPQSVCRMRLAPKKSMASAMPLAPLFRILESV
jgi:hypothetical protein